MKQTVEAYRRDPCGTLSIPYWKARTVRVPEDMQIQHQRDHDATAWSGYEDTPYFRLFHDLKQMPGPIPAWLSLRTAKADDLPLIVALINASYQELSVDLKQLVGYTRTEAYDPELWLIACERENDRPVGCGIADLDREIGEGALEWIQVLPEHRRRGVGCAMVTELLRRMQGRARFATVSGRVDDPLCPERLYRKCGFTGDDVWHVLRKK